MLKTLFMGNTRLEVDGAAVRLPAKMLGALAYLMVRGAAVPRYELASMMWLPEELYTGAEQRGLLLGKLRGAGGLRAMPPALAAYVVQDNREHTLRFLADDPSHPYELDFGDFLRPAPFASAETCAAIIAKYHGDFLEALPIQKPSDVEPTPLQRWLVEQRRAFRLRYLTLVDDLMAYYTQQERYDLGLGCLAQVFQVVREGDVLAARRKQKCALLALSNDVRAALDHCVACEQAARDDPETVKELRQLRPLLADPARHREELLALLPRARPSAALAQSLRPASPAFRKVGPLIERAEAEQAHAFLTDAGSSGILALVGMGGVGKTTLMNHLVIRLEERFAGAIYFGDLANHDIRGILLAWIKLFGQQPDLQGDLATQFRQLTSRHPSLIVLEDVGEQLEREHHPGVRKELRAQLILQIKKLLPKDSTVLITTRDRDLAAGLDARIVDLQVFGADDALLLLEWHVGAARVRGEPEAAQQICLLLEQLPLAIELAGQFLKSRERFALSDYEQLLRSRPIQMLDRVARSFEISWAMLGPELKQLFALLAIYGTREYDLASLTALAELEAGTALVQLCDLLVLSLVREAPSQRYRQHRLLAEFAQHKLEQLPELKERAIARYVDYYRGYAERSQLAWNELELELPHLMAALELAQASRPAALFPMICALEEFWRRRGYFTEARRAYAWGLAAATELNEQGQRYYCTMGLGMMELEQGEHAAAADHLQAAAAYYRARSDPSGLARCLLHLGRLACVEERFGAAETYLEEAAEIAEELEAFDDMGEICILRADFPYSRRQYDEAERLARQALAWYQRPHPRVVVAERRLGVIRCYRLLLDIAVQKNDAAQARSWYEQLLRLCDEVGDQAERALVLYAWAAHLRKAGELEAALECIRVSEEVTRRMGDSLALARVHKIYGKIQQGRGELSQAQELFAKSAAGFLELEKVSQYVEALLLRGDVLLRLGDRAAACQCWAQVRAHWQACSAAIAAELAASYERLEAACER